MFLARRRNEQYFYWEITISEVLDMQRFAVTAWPPDPTVQVPLGIKGKIKLNPY